jgi:hypothetical protein
VNKSNMQHTHKMDSAQPALDIVLCPSLSNVAASRAEHRFESEDAIESLA